MTHKQDNKTYEGHGFNRYAIAAEKKADFVARMEKDGLLKGELDDMGRVLMPYTTEQRAEIAGRIHDDASAFVAKHTAHKAEQSETKTEAKAPAAPAKADAAKK